MADSMSRERSREGESVGLGVIGEESLGGVMRAGGDEIRERRGEMSGGSPSGDSLRALSHVLISR
jgi:hypothetical protein